MGLVFLTTTTEKIHFSVKHWNPAALPQTLCAQNVRASMRVCVCGCVCVCGLQGVTVSGGSGRNQDDVSVCEQSVRVRKRRRGAEFTTNSISTQWLIFGFAASSPTIQRILVLLHHVTCVCVCGALSIKWHVSVQGFVCFCVLLLNSLFIFIYWLFD